MELNRMRNCALVGFLNTTTDATAILVSAFVIPALRKRMGAVSSRALHQVEANVILVGGQMKPKSASKKGISNVNVGKD
jgi:hypothetical protein